MTGRAFMSALVLLVCLIIDARLAQGAAAPIPCADLARLSLSNATVTAAEEIVAGEWAPPAGQRQMNLPPFCRVALMVPPQIRIEVWLPKDTWNGRYRGEGGGGYAGQISYGGLAVGIRAGYATASTDTGHPASAGGTFALNPDGTLNTQLITDFSERSLYELAVKAKAVIAQWSGNGSTDEAANFACVDGRHQPADFSVAAPARN